MNVNEVIEIFQTNGLLIEKEEWTDEHGVIYSSDKRRLIKCLNQQIKEYNVISECEIIEDSAFCDCDKLRKIHMPDGVKNIGNWSFCDCHNLRQIEIPESVISIGFAAFSKNDKLKTIRIPKNVTAIDSYAFGHNSRLKTVFFPNSLWEHLGAGIFLKCKRLKNIYVPKGTSLQLQELFPEYEKLIKEEQEKKSNLIDAVIRKVMRMIKL